MIKLVLVDDHEIFLKGLEGLLSTLNEFEVVNTYSSASTLIENLPFEEIDVLLLDVQLPDMEANHLLQIIREKQPKLKVLYLTLIRGNREFNKLNKIGIEGYILKDSPLEELKKAIIKAADGGIYFGERYGTDDGLNTATIPSEKILPF
jgi:DNA-binding NarL/FixJ family response regulator